MTFYGRLFLNPITNKYEFDAPGYGLFQSWDNDVAGMLVLQSTGWVLAQVFNAPQMWLFVKMV